MNSDKTVFTCLCQDSAISSLNGKPLKLVNLSTYLGSNISSTESNVSICIGKTLTAIDRLTTIWKSDGSEIRLEFFQVVAELILLHGCTTLTLTKHLKKKLDRNYTRILCFEQILEEQQLYGNLLPSNKPSK